MRCTCKAVQMHRCRWLLFIFIQPVWELGMWMQEYWGKGWQVNTAGYLCVSVYSPSCGFMFGSKSGSYVFLSGGREQLFPKKVFFGDTLGALDTFQCLRSSTNFLITVSSAVWVQPYLHGDKMFILSTSLSPPPPPPPLSSSSYSFLSFPDHPFSISCFCRRSNTALASKLAGCLSGPDLA